MRRLYLLRHGQIDANVLGIIAGKTPDMPLNETGLRQARLTAKALSRAVFHKIYMSPALRARQTAKQVSEHHVPAVFGEIQENFREINFGFLEGVSYKEIGESHADLLELYRETPSQCVFPKGESMADAYNRVGRGINKILIEHPVNENVLIVSHGGTMALIFLYLFDLNMDKMFHSIRHNNCGLSIIDLENPDKWDTPRHKPRIICMNGISHLKEEHY
ncbi:MAG: histidine phosphatase family protein [Parcubacteria group bacterium]|nr:histidine phosphatase family protein [Parcubacteria group bacterium]